MDMHQGVKCDCHTGFEGEVFDVNDQSTKNENIVELQWLVHPA